MENLLDCHGKRFRANIQGDDSVGRICIEKELVFLCQNEVAGTECDDKLGYKYSFFVHDGSEVELNCRNVIELVVLPEEKEEPKFRYFLASYTFPGGTGKVNFKCEGFPSEKLIRKDCAKICGSNPDNIVTMNIFEFKSKEDYEAFIS